MARPAARRKTKNPAQKVTRRTANKAHKGRPTFAGVAKVVQDAWVKDDTLLSNYGKLGLVGRLNGLTGGVELRRKRVLVHSVTEQLRADDGALDDLPEQLDAVVAERARAYKGFMGTVEGLEPTKETSPEESEAPASVLDLPTMDDLEAQISVAPQALRIGSGLAELDNAGTESVKLDTAPLHATHAAVRARARDGADFSRADFVAALEKIAASGVRRERWMSQQELVWLSQCVSRHGRDAAAISRDKRLNPFQQTPAQIRRKLEKFLAVCERQGLPAWAGDIVGC